MPVRLLCQRFPTRPEDYPGDINMKDVFPQSMAVFRTLGFKSLRQVGIVAPSAMWHQWFITRYPIVSDERTKRLKEGRVNIAEQLLIPDMIWVDNWPGAPEVTAQEIIDIQLGRLEPPRNRHLAQQLLDAMVTVG